MAAALLVLDGNVDALADRLTVKRSAHAARSAGPVFMKQPVVVAEAPSATADTTAAVPPPPGSHDTGALIDTCMTGTPPACTRWADGRVLPRGRR